MKYGLYFLLASLVFGATAALGATAGPTDRFIPLVQDGGGWTTELTVVNLSDHPAPVAVAFMTAAGFAQLWPLELTASIGTVSANEVFAHLEPGAILRIQSAGTSQEATRGFAEIYSFQSETQLGAYARLVRRAGDEVVQTLTVPFSPGNERKSRLPLDMTKGAAAELIWVSLTNEPVVELVFRDVAGTTVLEDQIVLAGGAQKILNVLERWPALDSFAGTLEWNVTYPSAGFYEPRTFAAISLWSREAGVIFAIPGMTLAADQDNTDPYN